MRGVGEHGSYSCYLVFSFYRLVDLASGQKKANKSSFSELYPCLHFGRFHLYLLSGYGHTGGGKDFSLYYPGWCVDIHSCLVSAAYQARRVLVFSCILVKALFYSSIDKKLFAKLLFGK